MNSLEGDKYSGLINEVYLKIESFSAKYAVMPNRVFVSSDIYVTYFGHEFINVKVSSLPVQLVDGENVIFVGLVEE